MPDLPEYMLQKEQKVKPIFTPDELLYRRVPDEVWDDWDNDGDIELDAIEFPDMSVTRESLGPADSARWIGERHVDWGVIGFKVKDIPSQILYQGAFIYKMRPVHRPLRRNYPHSEVQVFETEWNNPEDEIHVEKKTMPGIPYEAQQEWRELLRRVCRIVLRPGREDGTPGATGG